MNQWDRPRRTPTPTKSGHERTDTTMERLSEKALAHLATYLSKTPRVLLAVALSAPSESWARIGGFQTPCSASKIVMSSPYFAFRREYDEGWEKLDLCEDIASKLTDGDICGILICTNAKEKLKLLELPNSVGVRGTGLAPLSGSAVLERADLSMEYRSSNGHVVPTSVISESAVIPILQSILNSKECSLKSLRIPEVWRERKSKALGAFLERFNRECDSCNAIFYCESCDRLLCRECASEVVCRQSCGRVVCLDCCFPLEGDICLVCHGEDHDIAECYWQYLPANLKQMIFDYASSGLSMENLAKFWCECTKLKYFDHYDIQLLQEVEQARVSLFFLVLGHLSKGRNNEAVYLMFYVGLLWEVGWRSPHHLASTLLCHDDFSFLCTYFGWFDAMVGHTTLTADIVNELRREVTWFSSKCKGLERLKYELADFSTSDEDAELHCLQSIDKGNYSPTMRIWVLNLDSKFSKERQKVCCYKDTTLGWWLKYFLTTCIHTESPGITASTKYFRIVHKGKSIFVSSSGKNTLQELGIRDGDEITLGGVETNEGSNRNNSLPKPPSSKNSSRSQRKTSMRAKRSNGKNKAKSPVQLQLLTEGQLQSRDREAHSKAMIPVFEELSPILKRIREQLNALTLDKSTPKVRRKTGTGRKSPPEKSSTALLTVDGSKAGKVIYYVLVGEESNLYKTAQKRPLGRLRSVDLHGMLKDEAINFLDGSMVGWVDAAMKGGYPWVIPVDIICGGGNQVLSGAVKDWIRNNRQVANRPKKKNT